MTTPLRRNADFNLLWLSQSLSDLGTTTTIIAVPLLVLSIGGSAADAGTVGTVAALVRGIARLPAGALADRWNRRAVMLTSDVVRIVVFTMLSVSIATHHLSLASIVILVALADLFDVVFSPAEMAAISALVPKEQLSVAFARNEARSFGVGLAGPPLGGVLYGASRALPFVVDAITFAVSFAAVALIRKPMQAAREAMAPQSVLHDVADGVRHIFSDGFLRAVLWNAKPVNFAVTGSLFVLTLALRQHGDSATTIGLAQAVAGVGGFLGAFAAGWLQRVLSFRQLVVTICWALFASMALSGLLTPSFAMVVPLAAGMFLAPAVNAVLFGEVAAMTPDRLQGRVMSGIIQFATLAAAFAPAAVGLVIEHVSARAAMEMCAAAAGLAAVAATSNKAIARGRQ